MGCVVAWERFGNRDQVLTKKFTLEEVLAGALWTVKKEQASEQH